MTQAQSAIRRGKVERRRKPSLTLQLLRWKYRVLGRFWPAQAARSAFKLWFRTRRFDAPAREQRWARAAEIHVLSLSGMRVHTKIFGKGSKTVLLVHGWNGRGLQLGGFIQPLQEKGFRVVTVDLPGHGASSGNSSSVFLMNDALQAVQKKIGPIDGVIAHSFGVTATLYAATQGLKINRLVAISAPLNPQWLVERFATAMHLTESTVAHFNRLFNRRFGEQAWSRISTEENAHNVSCPVLFVHDRDDHDVPWQHSEQLTKVTRNAELFLTNDLGHRRILRNKGVVCKAADFFTENNP